MKPQIPQEEIQHTVDLYNGGATYAEIATALGFSPSQIRRRIRIAKDRELLPDGRKLSDTREVRMRTMNDTYAIKVGAMSDVVVSLDRAQYEWLMRTLADGGYPTLVEYLGELVREEHAREVERLAKRDPLG
jgi:DNA-binding Lrp family transcriptional regulator